MHPPLSEEQWKALATDRHLAVVANAGSGKTRVLTFRLLWLLVEHRVEIDRIVAITFTTKAAAEMRERVRTLIQSMLEKPELREAMSFSRSDEDVVKHLEAVRRQLGDARISTFHSFCAGLLRQFGHVVDIDPESIELSERDTATMRDRALRRAMHRYMQDHQPEILEAYERLDFLSFERAVASLARSAERFHLLEEMHGTTESVQVQCDRATRKALVILGRQVARILDHCISEAQRVTRGSDEAASFVSICKQLLEIVADPDRVTPGIFASISEHVQTVYAASTGAPNKRKKAFPGAHDMESLDKPAFATLQQLAAVSNDELDLAQSNVAWHAARVAELAHEAYTKDKRERNAIDFDDMMSGVVNLLERHPEIARYVRSTITHLMVDEYQDTNPTQYRLMQLLVPQLEDPSLPAGPRVFVVGDDKQSIYGFRDADVRLFRRTVDDLRRINEREGAMQDTLLSLATSYRMAKPLAEATNLLCEAFFAEESEYDVPYTPLACGRSSDHDHAVGTLRTLVTRLDEPEAGTESLSRSERESFTVVRQIVEILQEGALQVFDEDLNSLRPVGPGDIAVLARRVASVTSVAAELHAANVPFQVHGGRAFFSRPEVADLRNLLTAAIDPEVALGLAAVLRSPIFRLTDADLTLAAFGTDTRGFSWTALREVAQRPTSGVELQTAVRILEEAHERLRHEPPTDVLRDVLSQTDWFGTVFEHPRSAQILANSEKTFDIIRAASESPGATLRDVLDAIAVPAEDDREAESAYDLDPNAVQVMTIHAAKGLEFPVVILCDLAGARGWSSYTLTDTLGLTLHLGSHTMLVDSSKPIELPKGLIAQANAMIERDRDVAEARRLLYVALTRGKDHVFVSFVEQYNQPDPTTGEVSLRAPSGAMAILLQNLLLGEEPMLPQVMPASDGRTYQPERGPFRYHDRTERIPWEPMPSALSVTELLSHTDDQGLEGGSADAATIGTIVHDTLEVVLRVGIDTGWNDIAQQASKHPLASREVLGPALAHLLRLRDATLWTSLGGVTTERTIGAMLDETLLYGRVDALRVSGNAAELWDWKTSSVTADTRDAVAEHYAIQMQAYAWILLTTQQATSITTRLVFTSLIDDDLAGAVVEQLYTLEDVDRLRVVLTERRRTVASA